MKSTFQDREDLAIYFAPSEDMLNLWINILKGKYPEFDSKEFSSLVEKSFENLQKFSNIFSASSLKPLMDDLLDADESGSLKNAPFIEKIHWLDAKNIILNLKEIFEGKGIKHIFYFNTPNPLWDFEVTQNLMQYADTYSPDYTYAENIPEGMVPDIISSSLLETIEVPYKALEDESSEIDLIPFLRKNLNDFHVEIHYEAPDLRMLRLDFSLNSLRSIRETLQILSTIDSSKNPYVQLEAAIKKSPQVLYTLPSYLEVELISKCDYQCTFCPRQFTSIDPHVMDKTIIDKIEDYLNDSLQDVTVAFGGMGEPMLHPDILSYMKQLLPNDALRRLVIETSGYHMDAILKDLENISHQEKILWIINFNSLENYESIHAAPSQAKEKVVQHLDELIEIYKKNEWNLSNIYMQMLKMEENEDETDAIYAFAKERDISFLLQKYNTYNHLMPQKRVSDMTPLERSFCWHLRRDLFIRSNGSIAYCKQDVAGSRDIGDLHESTVKDIFEQRRNDFIQNYQMDYPESPDCKACDEYFTFNF